MTFLCQIYGKLMTTTFIPEPPTGPLNHAPACGTGIYEHKERVLW